MRATSAAETLQRVVATLNEDLNTDLVRITLHRPVVGLENTDWLLVVAREDPALRPFAEFVAKGEPLCGRLRPEKLAVLFGDRAADVRSAVLLPVPLRGMMAVGSLDANRFHPGMGTMFLKLIADAVSLPAAHVRFEPSFEKVPALVAGLAAEGDLVLTMGAGDVTMLGPELIAELDRRVRV